MAAQRIQIEVVNGEVASLRGISEDRLSDRVCDWTQDHVQFTADGQLTMRVGFFGGLTRFGFRPDQVVVHFSTDQSKFSRWDQ